MACLVALGCFAPGHLDASTIVGWDLRGVATTAVAERAPTAVADGVTAVPLRRGPGLRLAGLNEGFSADRWNWTADTSIPDDQLDPLIHKFPATREGAFERGEYYEFGFTVQWGYQAYVSTLDASFRRSAAASPRFMVWQYSLDNFATPGITIPPAGPIWTQIGWTEQSFFQYLGRNSGSGVAANYNYMLQDVGGQGGTGLPGNPMPTIDLSGIAALQGVPSGTTVTFRLYAWSGLDTTTATNTIAFGRQDGPVVGGAVTAVGNIPFTVYSDRPGADPAPGAYGHAAGTVITATAPSQVSEGGYVHRLTGWIGTGSVPAQGTGNSVTFTLNEPSTLEWKWELISSPPGPILRYDLTGVPNAVVETVAANTVAPGLTAALLRRGHGLVATNLTRGFSSNEWSTIPWGEEGRPVAIANGDYFQFAFTVADGYLASLSTLDHAMRRSAVNAPMFFEWQYSFDGFATPGLTVIPKGPIWEMLNWNTDYFTYHGRSAIEAGGQAGIADNYNWITERVDGQAEGNPIPTFDLSQEPLLQDIPGGTTVTFRLYGWGNAETTPTNTIALGRDNADHIGGPMITGSVRLASGTSEGFAGWQEQYFPGESDPAIVGPSADPDGDGIENLIEYALGLDPTTSSREGLPKPGVEQIGGERYLTLSFSSPDNLAGVTYVVRVAGDLSDWQPGAAHVRSAPDPEREGFTVHTYRDTQPLSASNRRFIQLVVQED
jgi:hypothetical protein